MVETGLTWLKTRVTTELMDELRLFCAQRKVDKKGADSIQAAVTQAVTEYLDPKIRGNPKRLKALSSRLEECGGILRQAAYNFRHFGHRDTSSSIVKDGEKLGFSMDLAGLEGEGEPRS